MVEGWQIKKTVKNFLGFFPWERPDLMIEILTGGCSHLMHGVGVIISSHACTACVLFFRLRSNSFSFLQTADQQVCNRAIGHHFG